MRVSTILLLLLLATAAHSMIVPRTTPIESRAPLVYKVQINDDPKTRWGPVIRDFIEPIKRFQDFLDRVPTSKAFFEGVEWYAKNQFKHQDFVAEIEAIAELADLPFEKLFFMNFMYEFSTMKACSAVLIRNSDGQVLHGRNLDFEMWELLANLAVRVEYYDGDRNLFGVDYAAGSVVAVTGERYGAFSVNVNTRSNPNVKNNFLSLLKDNAIPTVWLLRKTLEEQTNYKDAASRLMNTEIAGPVYYIVAGVGANDGMVIERDNKKVHAFYELTEERWFLVQTNYDRDQPDPIHDSRRTPAEHRLEKRGNEDFHEQELLEKIMFVWPTFNIATIMSVVMTPGRAYDNTTVWYGQNPKVQPRLHLQTN